MTRLSPRSLAGCLLGLCLLACPGRAGTAPADSDDCDSRFIAFIGSDAYQFSPAHEGELGSLRLFSILSYPRAAAAGNFGRALWRVQVFPVDGRRAIFTGRGQADLHDGRGAVLVEHYWDGRDDSGRIVPPGTYRFSFEARYLPDDLAYTGRAGEYEDLTGVPGVDEAYPSSDEIVVDYALSRERAGELRASAALTACQVQQHAPLEAGFGYNFYYGSTHAHSNYSDGGQATSSCSSGNAYGSGTFAPAAVYNYARTVAGLDFWLINEHNHLINDSVATNNAPVSEAKVRQRYQDGRAAAAAATVNDAFVGLYGMEWGVLTNSDQGHVTLIETPKLFGWETCTNCTGPNAECTAGSNCYFDVFTPKRYGYLNMYKRSVENPSSAGALGILAHPSSGQFDNFAFNSDADQALQGIAVRSGLAFTAAENCADANVATSDYSGQWRSALNLGFHLGPTADHDAHCNNFGQGLPTRTVYLLPNGSSPVLTKTALLQAHKARHFFASEDPNAQLVFSSSNGHVMGDIFGAQSGLNLHAAVSDPNGDTLAVLELWRGQIGAGVPASAYRSFPNQGSFSVAENLSSGTYYYYVHARQADGHDLWSAPMWITYTSGGDTQAPSTSIASPAAGATVQGTLAVTANASDNVGVTAVEFYLDGALESSDASAPYSWSWDTTGAANGAHSLTSKARDAAGNVGTSSAVSVTVANPTGTDVSNYRLVQAGSAITYYLPAGSAIPAGGYLLVGRDAPKSAFESFWRGGTPLPSNVVYVNSGGAFPQINGSETYTLYNAVGTKLDGPTIAMASSAGQSLRRKDPCNAAGTSTSWTIGASSTATPGSGAGAGCAKGVVVNEFSDAAGTGNYVYEFVELYDDQSGAGDNQAPSTSITSPADGASVQGTLAVNASASDNLGVTSVEFYLDGALKSTDAGAPYSWSWDTTGTPNGTHSLVSKARDAAGNLGTSSAVSVTVANPTATDVSNYRLIQAGSSITYYLPAGTVIPAGGYVLVGRSATQSAFEAFWRGGTPLPSNVVYVDSGGAFPQINGSETYTLYDAGGSKLDGATIAMASGAGQSLRRNDPCDAAGTSASWTVGVSSGATPGSGAGAGCAKGVVINEFSDAAGTGNYVYEFVELHNDR